MALASPLRFKHVPVYKPRLYHWFIPVSGTVGRLVDVVRWCTDSFGPPSSGDAWDYWGSSPDHLEIEIYDDNAALAFKMRWC